MLIKFNYLIQRIHMSQVLGHTTPIYVCAYHLLQSLIYVTCFTYDTIFIVHKHTLRKVISSYFVCEETETHGS